MKFYLKRNRRQFTQMCIRDRYGLWLGGKLEVSNSVLTMGAQDCVMNADSMEARGSNLSLIHISCIRFAVTCIRQGQVSVFCDINALKSSCITVQSELCLLYTSTRVISNGLIWVVLLWITSTLQMQSSGKGV